MPNCVTCTHTSAGRLSAGGVVPIRRKPVARFGFSEPERSQNFFMVACGGSIPGSFKDPQSAQHRSMTSSISVGPPLHRGQSEGSSSSSPAWALPTSSSQQQPSPQAWALSRPHPMTGICTPLPHNGPPNQLLGPFWGMHRSLACLFQPALGRNPTTLD